MSGLDVVDGIYAGSSSRDASAILQADSTTQGALFPRMTTTQRDAISSPATGLVVYNTTASQYEAYNGSSWAAVGSGAPASAEILTTAANASMSAEVVIPGLAGSADIEGAAGGGLEREFDNSGGGSAGWTTSPLSEDFDTTVKSHWYVQFDNTTASEKIGAFGWTPGSGAFDARMKILAGTDLSVPTTSDGVGLIITDSGHNNRLALFAVLSGVVRAFTYASASYTQRGTDKTYNITEELWLRIVRDGSNNCSFYYSRNGNIWHHINTVAFTLTVANIGLVVTTSSATDSYALVDWIRTDV